MVRKISLFMNTLLYPFPHLFPQRRQQLMELLEELTEDVPIPPCCEDLLEIWAEEFGACGLLLGNLSLFLIGFLLMIAVDVILWRWHGPCSSAVIHGLSVLYCLFKFKSDLPSTTILILLFTVFWALCGFWWSLAFLFLVYFTNMGVVYTKGGTKC